jgi:hypothetical protein
MQAVDAAIDGRDRGPLPLNRAGRRMTAYNVQYLVAVLARDTGIEVHLAPHGLRHSAITIGLDAGCRYVTLRTSSLRRSEDHLPLRPLPPRTQPARHLHHRPLPRLRRLTRGPSSAQPPPPCTSATNAAANTATFGPRAVVDGPACGCHGSIHRARAWSFYP